MLLTIVAYRFPTIPLWLHGALVALLNAVSVVLAVVLVCMVWPVLVEFIVAGVVVAAYAVATYPRTAVRQ